MNLRASEAQALLPAAYCWQVGLKPVGVLVLLLPCNAGCHWLQGLLAKQGDGMPAWQCSQALYA